MTPFDLQALPRLAPDYRITYGQDSSEYGQLRIPAGSRAHPVVILIHGGCWKAQYASLKDLEPMADALKADGIATWNIEYKRLGETGGGWPGTYLDVGRAVDHLRTLAPKYNLDLNHVMLVGHSAGGHLAMWAAARSRLANTSPLYVANPLRVSGVMNLAGTLDMTDNIPNMEEGCRDSVVTQMVGGAPQSVPAHYAEASAMQLLPIGVPQVLVWDEHEDFVPLPLAQKYERAATRAGDRVRLIVIPAVGHFELGSPLTSAWPPIKSAIRGLLEGRLP